MDSDTRSPTAGMPVVVKYLTPKEVWEMYCRSYSNFLKRLQNIIRKGDSARGQISKESLQPVADSSSARYRMVG
jgi:phage terminase small subunit